MDPFTASTAVVPLISLAGSCLSQCYRYGCSVAGAPEEARRLLEELVTLSGILVGLQALSQDAFGPHQQPNESISNLKEVVHACHTALDELKKHLEKALSSDSRTKTTLKRAVWPLKKPETLSLIDRIERVKMNLNLMVGSLSSRLIIDQQSVIKDMATNVRDLTNRMELDSHVSKRRQILDWLTTYDHEAAQRRAAEVRCESTGSWMLEDETFDQWLSSSKGGGLWINGLAGYGKTTLTSLVIDRLGDLQDASLSELSYFYFDANNSESLAATTFLGSVIRQYCTSLPSLPAQLVAAYESRLARHGSPRPLELPQLQSLLGDIVSSHLSSIIVVDGIDESKEYGVICGVLNSLAEQSLRTHIYVSSRPESGIRRKLSNFSEIQLAPALLEEDIAKYVQTRLGSEPRLRRLQDDLRQHLYVTVALKSHGMFRWAQCQLDDICKLRTDRAVRLALDGLPLNLENSYQLMLSRISKEDVVLAQRALRFLAHSFSILPVQAVAEAAVFNPACGQIDRDERLADAMDIVDICGSLTVFDVVSQEIRLAHHSVRECLEQLDPRKSMFAMPFPWAHLDLARTCLSYLLMPELSVGVRSTLNELEEILARFPLLEYAAINWVKHVEMGVFEAELLPLILQLLTPYSNPHFLLWLQVVMSSPLPGECIIPGNDRVTPQPLYYAASYGLIGTVEALISAGADVNVRAGRYGGTALHAAYYRDHPEVVELLLLAGADPRIRDSHGDTPSELQ